MCAKPLLLAASGNAHKIRELQDIFGDWYKVIPMKDAGFDAEIEENADTFLGNAVIKAQAVCAATGLPAIADDSGLTVDALNGEPGVYSARYCGHHGDDEANNDKLLQKLEGVENRAAAFHSVIAIARPGKEPLTAEGTCPGVILRERRGTGGFGYDPLFLYEPLNKTFAEVTEEEKNAVSHRARACAAMREILKELHGA